MKKFEIIQLFWRITLFCVVAYAFFAGVNLTGILQSRGFDGISAYVYTVWAALALGMVSEFIPRRRGNVGNSKQFGKNYAAPAGGYDVSRLTAETRKMNRGATGVLLFWLSLNAALAVFYFAGLISANAILLAVAGYYICDALCMYIWCPLQQIFMRSRCCADCRIYGWGYFLVYTPLILIPAPFTLSLSLIAFALLIRWEIVYALYPERFWKGSNAKLGCMSCRHKGCRIMRSTAKKPGCRHIKIDKTN